MAESERKAFKDWFDKDATRLLAGQFKRVHKTFDEKRFAQLAGAGLQKLEFNDRIRQFSDAMAATLPMPFPKAIAVVVKSLPAAQTNCDDSISDGWLQWPVGQFIADHGLEHPQISLPAMIELTQRFSAEFAVRPFVERYPDYMFEQMLALAHHENPHVRRWCSEGTRTRLPWGKKLFALIDDPSPIWPILDVLKDDPELYVRRSVANNINDLAKDHPKQVIKTCRAWSTGGGVDRAWLIRHGLRTLIKDGDRDALALLGYSKPQGLLAKLTVSPKTIAVGQAVTLSLALNNTSAKKQQVMLDYVVHYIRKNAVVNAKVFKWKTVSIDANSTVVFEKRHPMKVTTVRALYPGVHRLDIQVNGECLASGQFKLVS